MTYLVPDHLAEECRLDEDDLLDSYRVGCPVVRGGRAIEPAGYNQGNEM